MSIDDAPTTFQPPEPARGLHLYLKTLEVALDDERITLDEAIILSLVSRSLNIPSDPETIEYCLSVARGQRASPFDEDEVESWDSRQQGDLAMYQAALIAALDDDVISTDEMAIIEALQEALGVQRHEHALIEEAIRATATEDEQGRRRVDRLNAFITG